MSSLGISTFGGIFLILLALYKFIVYPAFVSPLSKIPNAHWSASISPLWILWTRYNHLENQRVHAAHVKLGPIIRLAPYELSVNDLESLKTVYGGGFEKGEWYSIFDNYGVPCMFSSWHSRPHSGRKRMISNVYSKSYIYNSPSLARQARLIIYERLFPTLQSAASKDSFPNGVDVHEIWNATTMDFITAYLFGIKNASNFLHNENFRKHWLHLYHARKMYTFFPQELPRLTSFCQRLGIQLVPTWVNDANRELETWTKERCDSALNYVKLTGGNESPDTGDKPVVFKAMLAGFEKERNLTGKESVLKNETLKYPDLSIASEMIDHLAAGHETAGITLTYISWHLSQRSALQDQLRQELLTLEPKIRLSSTMEPHQFPCPKVLDALPLLHAIIMETLRQRAAIPGGQPRMTPYPSCTLGKYVIPGGVRVGAQAYSIHRNPDVYPEPEMWDHMRWMVGGTRYTEDQRREQDRWFWAFSSGGRMCIGSNFALYEIKLIVASVYSNFRTTIVDDEGIEQEDGYTCGPVRNKLFLRFEDVGDE